MNFVYSIIVNYHFPLDRLDVYILYLKLAEGPRGGMPGCPPLAAPLVSCINYKWCMCSESAIECARSATNILQQVEINMPRDAAQ